MHEATLIDHTAALAGAAPNTYQRAHSILIAAKPQAVFDYVTNPKSWPEWLPSSHAIDCDDRPMRFGDTFHEHWSTRTGPVNLDWLVIACEAPRLWIGLTNTAFMGPILVQYDCVNDTVGTRFIRTLRNPARPKMPTADMIQRMDAEATLGLGNIKRIVEGVEGAAVALSDWRRPSLREAKASCEADAEATEQSSLSAMLWIAASRSKSIAPRNDSETPSP